MRMWSGYLRSKDSGLRHLDYLLRRIVTHIATFGDRRVHTAVRFIALFIGATNMRRKNALFQLLSSLLLPRATFAFSASPTATPQAARTSRRSCSGNAIHWCS
jgi:hypothetical protein